MDHKKISKTYVERRVYNGAQVKRGYKVAAIELVQCDKKDMPVELVKVGSQAEYSSGCSLHRGACFGHMCITPTMNVLPPHSLSFRSGDIRTQYYIATAKAFDNDSSQYIKELKETNYGKNGHLRSIMSTPVSGSARLVCVPHVFSDPRVVFVSANLASKILFCLSAKYDNGVQGTTYVERELREDDYVMLERAPSLSKYNNQPFKVKFWDKECLGIHPKVFSYFHGDYDGDEAHIYALGSPASVEEARTWVHPLDGDLESAASYLRENDEAQYEWDGTEGDMEFVENTTLSFDEIQSGKKKLAIGDYTRNGSNYLEMFKQRLDERPGTSIFLNDAIKGVKDIMRQQVSQGKIGDMSRVARISAMCFTRGKEGGTYVICRKSRVLLNRNTTGSTGCPAVRCIMSLCQASQQAALDAHRVGSKEAVGLDMISDLLKGRLDGGTGVQCRTLYAFKGIDEEKVRKEVNATWYCTTDSIVMCVAHDDICMDKVLDNLYAAYSPVVLAKIPVARSKEVCRKGICAVYNYYNIGSESDDIEDLVEAMCFKVSASTLPITTRDGMLSRGLGWMETIMACDYTKIPAVTRSISRPYSATSATMCANFSEL